ncbi:MAG: flagellar basal body rod protein FlgB [Spirochaetales bacterium]|nr:flagellar basal body rod protein FlgB [Spirochaetales bacterium]
MAIIEKAMGVRYERQGLIHSNIANMETPGYLTQDFSFEKVMGAAMNNGSLSQTNAKHMELDPIAVGKSREFYKEERPVDLDEEMMKLSENQLMYEIATKLMMKKFDGLKYAIDEGGKEWILKRHLKLAVQALRLNAPG